MYWGIHGGIQLGYIGSIDTQLFNYSIVPSSRRNALDNVNNYFEQIGHPIDFENAAGADVSRDCLMCWLKGLQYTDLSKMKQGLNFSRYHTRFFIHQSFRQKACSPQHPPRSFMSITHRFENS